MSTQNLSSLRAQKIHRWSWMPYLFFSRPEADRVWGDAWQADVQDKLAALERVQVETSAFIAPTAHVFAEPHREVVIEAGAAIGAECFVHGPVRLGAESSLNPRVVLDGGRAGIEIGRGVRIAQGARLYAFDHGLAVGTPIRKQKVRSRGILVEDDVWIGAGAGVTDGVRLGVGAVVGMGAVVTHDVEPGVIVAGVPARPVGRRGGAHEEEPSSL